jgi:hypothetical protein
VSAASSRSLKRPNVCACLADRLLQESHPDWDSKSQSEQSTKAKRLSIVID